MACCPYAFIQFLCTSPRAFVLYSYMEGLASRFLLASLCAVLSNSGPTVAHVSTLVTATVAKRLRVSGRMACWGAPYRSCMTRFWLLRGPHVACTCWVPICLLSSSSDPTLVSYILSQPWFWITRFWLQTCGLLLSSTYWRYL
jgi:hypothetical protein